MARNHFTIDFHGFRFANFKETAKGRTNTRRNGRKSKRRRQPHARFRSAMANVSFGRRALVIDATTSS